jgi:hypothetical protein
LQKRGLTAAPLKPVNVNRREILKDTEELLAAIDICLDTKEGNRRGDNPDPGPVA